MVLLEPDPASKAATVQDVASRTFIVSTWHPTEAGAREQARLRGLLDEAPAIRAILDENPARAAAMAASLGVLIRLVPALLPFLSQIASAMALHNPMGTTRWAQPDGHNPMGTSDSSSSGGE